MNISKLFFPYSPAVSRHKYISFTWRLHCFGLTVDTHPMSAKWTDARATSFHTENWTTALVISFSKGKGLFLFELEHYNSGIDFYLVFLLTGSQKNGGTSIYDLSVVYHLSDCITSELIIYLGLHDFEKKCNVGVQFCDTDWYSIITIFLAQRNTVATKWKTSRAAHLNSIPFTFLVKLRFSLCLMVHLQKVHGKHTFHRTVTLWS